MIRFISTAAMALALAGASAAQAPQQFDLICDVRNVQTGLPSSQFHGHFDLQAMRWCEAPCAAPRTLQAARNILLLTSSAESQPGGGYLITRRTIERTTGAYEFRVSQGGRVVSHLAGACQVHPYGSQVSRRF